MRRKILPCKVPKRFIIVVMVFIGYMNFFYLHTNIGMVVVDMTSSKRILHENGTMEMLEPEYNWNSQEKALVLSSFAYGRLLGPIGGALAGRCGGSTLYGIGILATGLATILSPFFLKINFYSFVLATAVTGIFESFSYASVSQLWSRWVPPNERAKCISISIIGLYGGSILSFIVAGCILRLWGWAALFYISGVATLLWCWIWSLVVKDDPDVDKHISEDEKKYIQENLNNGSHTEKLIYPWKDILTCVPFWTVCLCKICLGCGFTFTMMHFPQYIKDMNDIDIQKIGYISVIPQLCAVISMPLSGFLLDYLRSHNILSVTNSHKLFETIGLISGAVGFIIAALWPNFLVCVVCISMFQFFCTFVVLDIQVLILDLAPRYAAFMNSVANSFFTGASSLTPIFVGFVVTSHSQLQWGICFLTFSIIFIIVMLVFLKFGSGKLQSWANFGLKHQQDATEQRYPPKYVEC